MILGRQNCEFRVHDGNDEFATHHNCHQWNRGVQHHVYISHHSR